jgi:hypothetical protein
VRGSTSPLTCLPFTVIVTVVIVYLPTGTGFVQIPETAAKA